MESKIYFIKEIDAVHIVCDAELTLNLVSTVFFFLTLASVKDCSVCENSSSVKRLRTKLLSLVPSSETSSGGMLS